jgi:hypothetical protein
MNLPGTRRLPGSISACSTPGTWRIP